MPQPIDDRVKISTLAGSTTPDPIILGENERLVLHEFRVERSVVEIYLKSSKCVPFRGQLFPLLFPICHTTAFCYTHTIFVVHFSI